MRHFSLLLFYSATFLLLLLSGCKTNNPSTTSDDRDPEIVMEPIEETKDMLEEVRPEEERLEQPISEEEVVIETIDREELTEPNPTMTDDIKPEAEEADFHERTEKSAMISMTRADGMSSTPSKREGIRTEIASGRDIPNNNISPKAGQITAAEWNDLYNWNDWKELLNNQDYNEMQTHWQIFPRSRYSIFLKNKYELPLQDIRVDLMDKSGRVVWTALTDNSGRAELWADFNDRDKSFDLFDARITDQTSSYIIEDLKTIEQGVNDFSIDRECRTEPNVDVLFTVDATGSMGDEIQFLQSELKNVISRVTASDNSLNVRMGAVFYRDSTDEYVTNIQPFSDRHEETLSFIDQQSAKGGGDYPEAVDAALEASLAQDWSEHAVARIIFLLLDAPPHHNPVVLQRIEEQVADAAREGIKIIPITASGINRQTEFLMKFMAIATNGTYVFITDHSGIGNPHLDPVVKDYEVEKLNDLLVRLLYHYTKSNGCNANESVSEGIEIFPNPASDYINVRSDKPVRMLKLLSNSGKLISKHSFIEQGENRIDLAGLVDGMYSIQCSGDEGLNYSLPFVVVNNR